MRDIPIKAGETFLLPPRVPHSPQRMPDSVGLVIERKRLAHEDDGLLWFCRRCNRKLYEEYFHLHDIEKDFPPVFDRFYSSREHRTCQHWVPEPRAIALRIRRHLMLKIDTHADTCRTTGRTWRASTATNASR